MEVKVYRPGEAVPKYDDEQLDALCSPEPLSPSGVMESEGDGSRYSFFIEQAGLPIGVLIASIIEELDERFMYISVLCVSSEHRGKKGYGKKLLEKLYEVARAAGVNKIKLNSVPDAETFYEKHGFVKTGDSDACSFISDLDSKSDCTPMEKTLAGGSRRRTLRRRRKAATRKRRR